VIYRTLGNMFLIFFLLSINSCHEIARDAAYRENVAKEIYRTEKDYLNNLNLLVEVLYTPTFLHFYPIFQ